MNRYTTHNADKTLHGSSKTNEKSKILLQMEISAERSDGGFTWHVLSHEDLVAHVAKSSPSRTLIAKKFTYHFWLCSVRPYPISIKDRFFKNFSLASPSYHITSKVLLVIAIYDPPIWCQYDIGRQNVLHGNLPYSKRHQYHSNLLSEIRVNPTSTKMK